jgi:formylmethanofuran dehydrogenase subunit E
MEAALDRKHSDDERLDRSPEGLSENLAQTRRDLNDVIEALALLGIKRCSQCKHFFSSSDPGALFGNGELVCYGCVPEWWASHSGQIGVAEREKAETKLSSWLRKHHGAQIVKEERGRTPEANPLEFKVVVHCSECGGSGKLLQGERCRFCNGFGTVWIVAPR